MSRAAGGTAFSRRRFLGAAAGIAVGAAGAGALELGWHRDSNAPPRSHYRAIVVGSGYGGGVSALRLGEAGVNTLILEKGRLWDSADADGKRFSRMLPADNRAGWFTSVPPSLVPSFRGVSMDTGGPACAVTAAGSGRDLRQGRSTARTRFSAERPSAAGHDQRGDRRDSNAGAGPGAPSPISTPPYSWAPTSNVRRRCCASAIATWTGSSRRHGSNTQGWAGKYAAAAGYRVDYNGSAYSFDYMRREEAGKVPRSALDFEQQYGNNYGRVRQRRSDIHCGRSGDRQSHPPATHRGHRHPPRTFRRIRGVHPRDRRIRQRGPPRRNRL